MLLRFRTENHRSFRDSAELSLMSSSAKGAVPADRNWIGATTRVAGIYGANASGKSTLLHAIDFMCEAVRYSATRWGDRDGFPYHPFALDDASSHRPSVYEIDFVFDDARFNYGFSSDSSGVHEEWLYSYFTNRRSTLFERNGQEFTFGRSLPGENATISKLVRPTALFLSAAANSNHPMLTTIKDYLSHYVPYAKYDESDRLTRLAWVREALEDERLLRQASSLICLADLGISGLVLEERDMDDRSLEIMRRVWTATKEGGQEIEPWEEIVNRLRTAIRFSHEAGVSLPIEVESSGTVAWLSLGMPAIQAIRDGETLMIDEIDSSLHPRLTATLIGMFRDPVINVSGAQLIFTSHDTTLLGKVLGEVLEPDEVWFAEKKSNGRTDLYSLNEFSVRTSDNFERRYLQGRYGAVPMVELDELRRALLESDKQ